MCAFGPARTLSEVAVPSVLRLRDLKIKGDSKGSRQIIAVFGAELHTVLLLGDALGIENRRFTDPEGILPTEVDDTEDRQLR